jgi:hypothetical protein
MILGLFSSLNLCGLQLLGRSINLAGLIRQRMNKMFRENLDFLLERFESQDLCAIVVGAHFSLVFQLYICTRSYRFLFGLLPRKVFHILNPIAFLAKAVGCILYTFYHVIGSLLA